MSVFIRVLLSLFLTSQAWAYGTGSGFDFGVEVGFRQQSGDSPTGFTAKTQTGYQVGIVGTWSFAGDLGLRLGYLYTQRPLGLTNDTTKEEFKYNLNSFDIPLALNYKFEDFASIFAGLNAAIHLDSSCSGTGCKVSDVKTPVFPFQLGASFKFAPQLGATVYFESLSGSIAKDLSGYRAVGANLLITFE